MPVGMASPTLVGATFVGVSGVQEYAGPTTRVGLSVIAVEPKTDNRRALAWGRMPGGGKRPGHIGQGNCITCKTMGHPR